MTDAMTEFETRLGQRPLVAIIRGMRPEKADITGAALAQAAA